MKCTKCGCSLSPMEIESGICEWCASKTKKVRARIELTKRVSWWEQEDKVIKHKSAAAAFIK